MRALTPAEFQELEALTSPIDRLVDADYDESALNDLVDQGRAVRHEDCESIVWHPTPRAELALRVHRAALAAGVVL